MEAQNPDYLQDTEAVFTMARFVVDLGIEPTAIRPGEVEARLRVQPRHLQQDGVIHAGVQATLADHTAGAAAYTVLRKGQRALSTSFTVHLLQTASGEELRCKARVLRAGRRLIVTESEVHAVQEGTPRLVSKTTVTLAVMDPR
ncbi:Phenylacetic acid degradation protein paaI [Myxococcus hansupus]|uniref:Phenylacetic acid degradation protein paaI n=1 Tax=Pseudomyxococcus hansupus TaxID=1297742 RepID=A0A0H4WQ14_9BACT|nr:PaaI family thioesterase [Myxococcus hansupus]AKQ65596.1 Phenylacetic acid degradation protein paaI [Myxococcus hansupus]